MEMKQPETMSSSKSYQAILFEFDGVLAQSMDDNSKAWQAVTKEYGLTIKAEDYFPLEGMPVKDLVVNLFQRYGQPKRSEYRKIRSFERCFLFETAPISTLLWGI